MQRLGAGVLVCLLVMPGVTGAAEEALSLPEIMVSAQKIDEPGQLVPLSLAVVDGLCLEESETRSVTELSRQLPNFHAVGDYSGGRMNLLYVRGIGSTLNEPSVGFLVDGVAMMREGLYDIDLDNVARVELLRGPQGTLYGRNTQGGVVHVITREPGPDTEADARLTLGERGLAEGALSLRTPVLGDVLSVGLAGSHTTRDGYTRNDVTGQDIETLDEDSGQLQLRWNPTKKWDVGLNLTASSAHNGAFALTSSAAALANPHHVQLNMDGFNDRQTRGGALTIAYRGDEVEMTAISSALDWDNQVFADADMTLLNLLTQEINDDHQQYSQELRFASPADRNRDWRWLAGLYLYRERLNKRGAIGYGEDAVTLGYVAATSDILVDQNLVSHGQALFGQTTLSFWKPWEFTLGLRYARDRQEVEQDTWMETGGAVVTGSEVPYQGEQGQGIWLPKVAIGYHWQPDLYTYASLTKGYRGGGYNYFYSTVDQAEFGPETTWNYEAGIKSQWWGDRLRVNLALFHIDWKDQQVEQFLPGYIQFYQNAARSTSRGLELETAAKLNAQWEIQAGYGYTDARFETFTDALTGTDLSGNQVPLSPRHTATVALQHERPLTSAVTLSSRLEWQGLGDIYWDSANTSHQGFYSLINARAALQWQNWEWAVWGKNLTDAVYEDYGGVDPILGDNVHLGPPLWIGTSLSYHY